jgi:hypothetical protein
VEPSCFVDNIHLNRRQQVPIANSLYLGEEWMNLAGNSFIGLIAGFLKSIEWKSIETAAPYRTDPPLKLTIRIQFDSIGK